MKNASCNARKSEEPASETAESFSCRRPKRQFENCNMSIGERAEHVASTCDIGVRTVKKVEVKQVRDVNFAAGSRPQGLWFKSELSALPQDTSSGCTRVYSSMVEISNIKEILLEGKPGNALSSTETYQFDSIVGIICRNPVSNFFFYDAGPGSNHRSKAIV